LDEVVVATPPVAVEEKKSNVFDANSEPVPINPFAEKYTASTSEETKERSTGKFPDSPPVSQPTIEEQALLETVIPEPHDLSQSKFVDILEES